MAKLGLGGVGGGGNVASGLLGTSVPGSQAQTPELSSFPVARFSSPEMVTEPLPSTKPGQPSTISAAAVKAPTPPSPAPVIGTTPADLQAADLTRPGVVMNATTGPLPLVTVNPIGAAPVMTAQVPMAKAVGGKRAAGQK